MAFSLVARLERDQKDDKLIFFDVVYLSNGHCGYLITMSSHDEQERRLLILYATETGNAQDVADRVARTFRTLHFQSRVMSVDCYTLVRNFSSPS